MSRLCNVDRVRGDMRGVLGRMSPGRRTTRPAAVRAMSAAVQNYEGTNMSNANDIFLQAIQPVVDIFWTMVWTATGSTVSVPRPVAPVA